MLWLAAAAAAEQATVDAHGDVSDAFDAALQLNAAEHEAQMEVACSHFSCSVAADYDVPPMSRWSMGPVQILNDYSETLQGEDQIFVSEEPLFSPAECEDVIRLTELEGEGLPSSQSGKYKLGKAWIKDMPQVKDWFNEALRTKVPSSSSGPTPTQAPTRPAPAPLPPRSRPAPAEPRRVPRRHRVRHSCSPRSRTSSRRWSPTLRCCARTRWPCCGTTPRTLARTSTWTTRCSPSRWRSRTQALSRAAARISSTSTACCQCRRVHAAFSNPSLSPGPILNPRPKNLAPKPQPQP